MMLRKKSSRWAGAKTLVVLPLTALALGAFAQTAYVVPKDKGKKENVTITVSGTDISAQGLNGKIVRVVDGREVSRSALDSIPVEQITHVQVTKTAVADGSAEKSDGRTIHITMKREGGQENYQVQMSGAPQTQGEAKQVRVFTVSDKDSTRKSNTIVIRSAGKKNFDENVVWIVDGREVDPEVMSRMKPEDIESISVEKDDASRTAKYPGQKVEGIIRITTKTGDKETRKLEKAQKELTGKTAGKIIRITTDDGAAKAIDPDGNVETVMIPQKGQISDNILIYVDGKQSSNVALEKMSADEINTMRVLTGKDAIKKYGEKARDGVIEIQTKK